MSGAPESWQHVTYDGLCERMYPNYAMFCQQTGFGDGHRRILDLIWETLTVKDAKVNFDSQLEKREEVDSFMTISDLCTAFIRQSMLAWR